MKQCVSDFVLFWICACASVAYHQYGTRTTATLPSLDSSSYCSAVQANSEIDVRDAPEVTASWTSTPMVCGVNRSKWSC